MCLVDQEYGKYEMNWRKEFIIGALGYVRALRAISVVESIALFGSLTTDKPDPKDVDLLIRLGDEIKIERLMDGSLKGVDEPTLALLMSVNQAARDEKRRQGQKQFAEIFVATSDSRYIGRLSLDYRSEPLREDFEAIGLPSILAKSPPIELWPVIKSPSQPPEDIRQYLLRPLHEEDGIPMSSENQAI